MRESSFIEQNKEKWIEFEDALKGNVTNPEKIGELFIGITDDLSYARTFYPNRSVRVYLNNLSQRIFHILYKKRTGGRARFWKFWSEDLPAVMYSVRYELLVSFLIFGMCMLIGWMTAAHGASAPAYYKRDFMEYYRENTEVDFFLGVTINNIRIAFMTFVTGVFLGVGTLFFIMSNGVFVGMVLRWLHDLDYLGEASMSLWLHGAMEISAIIIAGAAGLTLGRGLALPGTFPRMTSFLFSARRGITIMMAAVPLFLMAGFIEGFLTRHREVPDPIRLTIIFTSLAFIIWFFVIYPFLRVRSGLREKQPEAYLSSDYAVTFVHIKPIGDVLKEAFILFRRNFTIIFVVAASAGILLTAGITIPVMLDAGRSYFGGEFGLGRFGDMVEAQQRTFTVGSSLSWSLVGLVCMRLIGRLARVRQTILMVLPGALLFGFGINLALSLGWPWGWLLALAIAPILMMMMSASALGDGPALRNMFSIGRLFNKQAGNVWGLFLITVLMGAIGMLIIVSPLMWLMFWVSSWFVDLEGYAFLNALTVTLAWLIITSSLLLAALLALACGVHYFTLREIQFAPELRRRIAAFGSSKGLA